ncbi:MAG: hypothetical protein E6R03_10485 [Hyphomicrobiaceae bacterium]|nr:MAG: hypothetical protein E6R03_10485 [Hyphomicrobiaceae bacterium]
MAQESYNPADTDYFRWTADELSPGAEWYTFDSVSAHAQAKHIRDCRARSLRALSHKVRVWTLRNQRITRGGIGTGKPEIDLVVSVYMLEIVS